MYGMVNKLLIEALEEDFGRETRMKIEEQSGVRDGFFVGMEQYPDHVTYDVVGAASEIVGIPVEQLLENFGKKWIQMTAASEYGHYYAMADNLFDFLENLNSMHQSLGAGLTELRPPTFVVSRLDDNTVELQYISERPGLTSFVIGLVQGLAVHYGQDLTVSIMAEKQKGARHDQFLISMA